MSGKFFVGQRVKILWSVAFPELRDTFGTIVGKVGEEAKTVGNGQAGPWYIAPDAWRKQNRTAAGVNRAKVPSGKHKGMMFTPDANQLIPTDCYDVISWHDAIPWKPEQYQEH